MVVTGAAGFIGSHLAERLISLGHHVVGVDCFSDYYDLESKRSNLTRLLTSDSFDLREVDLVDADLEPLVDGAEAVFHLAGQPGVRGSWEDGFRAYNDNNTLATQRLLEAVRRTDVGRLVYSSSSSIYGNAPSFPTNEDAPTRPHSPYGVTKLAAELLCSAYARNFGVPTVSLRYFTVYGPRQRPDMAFHRLIESGLSGAPFKLFGTGEQVRDFTFVQDVVAANLLAAEREITHGDVFNVSGGSTTTMTEVIATLDDMLGGTLNIVYSEAQAGDVDRTGGDTEHAHEILGWSPQVSLRSGLESQVEWHRTRCATAQS